MYDIFQQYLYVYLDYIFKVYKNVYVYIFIYTDDYI